MAEQLTHLDTEQGPSLAPVATPKVEAENTAPIVLASNDVAAHIAANLQPAPVSATAAPVVKADTYEVVVKAPAAHNMLAYLVGPGAHIVLQDIDLNQATLTQEGGNLRITLPNGAEVLLLDYVNSAHDRTTVVVTPEGELPAQKLLAALSVAEDHKLADVKPAAGPQAGGEGGGLTPPTILGTGVGSGQGIFSSVIGPYAIPRPTDGIGSLLPPPLDHHKQGNGNPPSNPNLPPIAHDDSFSTAQDKTLTLAPGKLLANDSDPEGDPIHIVSVQGASHGTVSIDGNGNVVFVPEPGFHGTGSFSYTIADNHGGTSTADVTIQIDPTFPGQNTVIAADDAASVVAGRDVTVNVLANDSDPQGDTLVPGSVRILSINDPHAADGGSATVNPDGTITYHSVGRDPYTVTLVYEVSDDRGARDTATVTIEVTPAANSVVAIDDTGEIIPAGAAKTFNVTGNDYDPQGDAFHISRIVGITGGGSASFDPATGNITYQSTPGHSYTATIVYEIVDDRGATDTATLTVRVEETNNVSAVDDTAEVQAGQDVDINVLRNDFDAQGDAFHIIANSITVPHDANGNVRGEAHYDAATNTIIYTDNSGQRTSGVVEFTYQIEDARGAVDTAVVRVTITPAVNGVDANNDTLHISQDAARTNITGVVGGTDPNTLLFNDFDPQGDNFHITAIGSIPASQGTLELVGDQVFFTPAHGYHGPVNFTYTITDDLGAQDTAQVTINVLPPESTGLTAGNDNFVTPFNTDLTITPAQLLSNDNDPDGTVLNASNIISHTNPLNGTITMDANGNFIYNPNDTFRGTDTFTYTIRDAQGDEATATVTIRVQDPLSQDNPVDAVDDLVIMHEGETKTVNALSNDSAPDGGLAYVGVIGALPAGVVDLGGGRFSYTAPAGSGGHSISFQYEVRDVDGDTDTATVTFRVLENENSVIANDDTANDVAAHPVVINVLANDSDPQGDSFSITSHTNPAHGTVVQNADGTFTYTAVNGYQGTDTFTYTITDSKGATDTATVTITVGPNTVVAVNDAATMPQDVNSILINAIANDFDPQGDNFSITRIVSVDAGTASIENGQIRYNNPSRDAGVAHIVYEITDQYGATSQATITVTINADTNSVIAQDDVATDVAAHPVTINVLANDSDPQGDSFSITAHTNPAHGSLVQNANGTFTYVANAGYTGLDTFTYTITDSKGATDTATVTITVNPNTVVAVNDAATMPQDVNSILVNAIANDFDPQGDNFSITRIVSVDAGTATIENGQIRYTNPTRDFGVAHIVYEITDQYGATSQATVTVTIAADTNSVIANDDSANDVAAHPVTINVLANDSDPQGDAFSITSHTNPAHGTLVQNANGTFTYTAVAGYQGVDTFTYTITDSKGATDTATVTINVGPNTVVAVDDTATMAQDVNSILINAKANDFDPQGDNFSITSILGVTGGGTATIENGQIRYTDSNRDAHTATITYEITDQFGAKDTAVITVNVAADSNSVIANDDSATVGTSRYGVARTVVINELANDTDPQGDSFHLNRIVSGPAIGSVSVNADGTITYHAASTLTGYTTTFVYEIVDSRGATDTATVTVKVAAQTTTTGGGGGGSGGGGGGDCPLTIDLTGAGIHISMQSQSNAHFDLDGNGTADWTAWAGNADTGILAIDRNGNGVIDNVHEVFGGQNLDGFTELANLEDTNHDGIIDAKDANFSQLKLWVDANSDGITDAGELHSLSEFGITSIDLHATGTSIQYGDAYIGSESTVHYADGSTGNIGSVFYTNDSNGHITGTSGSDILVYSSAADSIDGGQGADTLKVMTASDIVINHDVQMHGVENIDLANNGTDHLTLNVNDLLTITDHGVLTIRGDAVDDITLTGDVHQGANVTQGDVTYATYSGAGGGTVMVELGLTVHTPEQQHHQ